MPVDTKLQMRASVVRRLVDEAIRLGAAEIEIERLDRMTPRVAAPRAHLDRGAGR